VTGIVPKDQLFDTLEMNSVPRKTDIVLVNVIKQDSDIVDQLLIRSFVRFWRKSG
jgi:hypothetical protein